MPPRTVLLTRPRADSERVARELAADGIATAIWPLTEIVPAPGTVSVPSDTGALVFTSKNAVTAFAAMHKNRSWPVWCVGGRTSSAAQAAGFSNVFSAGGDVTDLVSALLRADPTHLLYLRGQDVSQDLPTLLGRSHHRVTQAVVYAAQPGGPPPDAVAEQLAKGEVAVITIWSRRAAEILAAQVAKQPGWQINAIGAVAISRRAAEPLADCRFSTIDIAEKPTGSAVLDAIRVAVRQKAGESRLY